MPVELGIIGTEWFTQVILPFLLVFTLIFAILEKTKILGEGKKQINSIISLVLALILIGVPLARGIISRIVPIIAVLAVLILLFMLLLGFVGATKDGALSPVLRIAIGIISAIVLIIGILWSAGWLSSLLTWVKQPASSTTWQSVIFLIIIMAVVAVALKSSDTKKE